MLAINFADIEQAAGRIAPWAHRTPVLTSKTLNRETGKQIYLKAESFQVGGAFKFRGACNFVFSLSPEELKRGVLAYSSGNHAQAVALAAQRAGAKATVVMPSDAPKAKMAATAAAGATIVQYDRMTEDREAICRKLAEESGATVIPPFDHPLTIAGQGTAAIELLEEAPELDALVACLGGGGLLGGCAVAAKAMRPGIRVFGAEPELANDFWMSLQQGKPVAIPPPPTIADGLRTLCPGKLTFPIVQQHVEAVVLISEDEIKAAVRFLLERLKIVVEPSGAVGVAAALFGKLPAEVKSVGVVISGGNVDLDQLAALCA
ncbi:MAG: pyridoxal-phosphate dependent enzyme [Acidobacteriaceae bacterium]|nr:pyridoxal-phosphate dependent enzyme [Acidobacteriaceae bacterium]